MLHIRYAPDIPPAMIELLEHHARQEGLSLGALETLGASLDHVEAFIIASENGEARQLLAQLDLAPAADDPTTVARWQANKILR